MQLTHNHDVQTEDIPETMGDVKQISTHQSERQAPHAQPPHQQGYGLFSA